MVVVIITAESFIDLKSFIEVFYHRTNVGN